MGLKKYEIITVGSDKRVRALRSWAVGGRYVNIGDVGGIVYDEKTLSQDGACWLFRGNFGFPGARIGGDSIVDVAEAALSTAGAPNVDILGSSVVVGSKLQFEAEQTAANAVVLTASDFEPGAFGTYIVGQPLEPVPAANYIRTKNPIFLGGKPLTVKVEVPGYSVGAVSVDADGLVIAPATTVTSGVGVTLAIPAGQYAYIRLGKDPVGPTVPADATTAKITFTGTYETKLSIIDSRLEINPATSAGILTLRPGGVYTMTSGEKYPEMIIRNSKVSMLVHATSNRAFRIMGQIIGSTATLDGRTGGIATAGLYSNVKNLMISGALPTAVDVRAYNSIQATDCDNFAVSPTIFPGMAAAQTANMPFIFQGCNVPGGVFYHHAQIANTYKNIDFALAQADLGKATASSGVILVSSEVEGMYRATHRDTGAFGALVESWGSVSGLSFLNNNPVSSYGTTIYKDAYLNGLFQLEGTNVFGNKVRSHPLAQVLNVQPRAVQGAPNTVAVGETITGYINTSTRVRSNTYFRLNRAEGLKVSGIPSGIQCVAITTDINNKIITLFPGWTSGELTVANNNDRCYLMFRKPNDSPITPDELTGVTVTVYNGCKIVNTGATSVNMKGAIRVEDNATLINSPITGTGYFGGNAVMSGVTVEGCAYVKDNAVIVVPAGSAAICSLKMTENAYAAPAAFTLNGHLWLSGNSRFIPAAAASGNGDLFMQDNAVISGSVSVSGSLTMKDNATVSAGTLTIYGDAAICGSYNQTVNKTWTGKRVIDNDSAPAYDNNVKTQYDF